MLNASEEEEFPRVAAELVNAVALRLHERLGLSKELSSIYADEILDEAHNIVCDVVKEVHGMKDHEYG
jgi:hypothetical protein